MKQEELEKEIKRAAKQYAELQDKHGRALQRLNGYADKMVDLDYKMRRWNAQLAVSKREEKRIQQAKGNRG